MLKLNDRAVIAVCGKDNRKFLQGLLTNDLFMVDGNRAIFALMLNAKGRVLYDFFIIEGSQGNLLLECNINYLEEILHRFSLYCLNHEVNFVKTDYKVYVNLSDKVVSLPSNCVAFIDPRDPKMGSRIFISEDLHESSTKEDYLQRRVENCIADVAVDLVQAESFPLDYRMHYAFSFNKGCYVGQEVTARFKLKGETSKKLYLLKYSEESNLIGLSLPNELSAANPVVIKKDADIIGYISSMSGSLALALCKTKLLNEVLDPVSKNAMIEDHIFTVVNL